MPADEPRFLAGSNLARAARWARMLGYDCALPEEGEGIPNEVLLEQARRERRILLTTSRALAAAAGPDEAFHLPIEGLVDQLRRLVDRYPIDFRAAALTRCTLCNEILEDAAFKEMKDELPPLVRERRPALTRCPRCGRLYWEGTHLQVVRRMFAEQLGVDLSSPDDA